MVAGQFQDPANKPPRKFIGDPKTNPETTAENRVTAAPEVEKTETVADGGAPAFHVLTYKNNRGWVIIAADRRVRPVLAYSYGGKLDAKNPKAGMRHWMEFAKRQIKSAKQKFSAPQPQIEAYWKQFEKGLATRSPLRTSEVICDPYRTPCPNNYTTTTGIFMRADRFNPNSGILRWGQEFGYNAHSPLAGCGNCNGSATMAPAGCGPVAVAQVMAYWQKPSTALGTTLNYPLPATISFANTCATLNPAEEQIARLIRRAGQLLSSTYHYFGTCNTFSNPFNINNAFSAEGYSQSGSSGSFWNNLSVVDINLYNKRPVIFWGTTCDTCMGDAHIWVCDGIEKHHYFTLDCSQGYPNCLESGWVYYHMNWGDYDPDGAWCTGYNFTWNGDTYDDWLHVVVGIQP